MILCITLVHVFVCMSQRSTDASPTPAADTADVDADADDGGDVLRAAKVCCRDTLRFLCLLMMHTDCRACGTSAIARSVPARECRRRWHAMDVDDARST